MVREYQQFLRSQWRVLGGGTMGI